MDWIRVDAALPTHRKSIELGEILGEPLAWARMVRLWCWAKANAADGVISGRNPSRLVEAAVGWEGEADAFVEAALEVGFLRREGDHLALHDWQQHNGKALKRAEEAADRTRRWREQKEAERIRKREEELATNAPDARSQTHTERLPNAERDVTRRDVTRRDVTTTTAGSPQPTQEAFRLEAQTAGEARSRRLSPAQAKREELRAMRAAALTGVVDDIELKPAALARIVERLEQEATAKGSTIADAYSAFLQDDYARSRNPPCPLGLFVDGNKFRECLSAALRSRGKGPLTLVSSRKPGSYASLAEIEAQEFTVDPVESDRKEAR